nr:DUF3017 domain-containing protein [Streptomyces pacificus]
MRAGSARSGVPGEAAARNGGARNGGARNGEARNGEARNGGGTVPGDGGGPGRSARAGDRAGAGAPADGGDRTATAGGAADAGAAGAPEPPNGSPQGPEDDPAGAHEWAAGRSRRPPTVTRDTARPEGGGRAAPGDAPAPARQWPLLTVLGLAALGLLVVGADPFDQAFRVGTILVGAALLTGAALRRTLPSVGMLAVRSCFTDMITYGVLGTVIVLLALMVQPRPWWEIPFLEEAVRFTVR